jgi:hypothetical protein
MSDGDIVYNLMESLREHYQDRMVDRIPSEYLGLLTYTDVNGDLQVFKPSRIKVGRLQDDPTRLSDSAEEPSCLIEIHSNDPNSGEDKWKHQIARNLWELSGAQGWWRNLYVDISCYFIDSDQVQGEAARLGNALRAMCEHFAKSQTNANPYGWQVASVSDVFGEQALMSFSVQAEMIEGGGPTNDYIWRGGVWVAVQTVQQ